MALRLDAALKEQSRLAVFAAVAASPDRVSVCTAGDIRVHLGWDGRLQATTQDHTYATDPLFAAEANAIPPAVRANVATRGIGDGAKAPPEGGHWDVPGPYTVLVCSSRVHRRRPPPEYFAEVVENLRSPRFEVAGFACSIRFGD
jgi:serine/threonine protein phosphatase PrpC